MKGGGGNHSANNSGTAADFVAVFYDNEDKVVLYFDVEIDGA